MAEGLVQAMADLKLDAALAIVRERLDTGEDPLNILADSRSAMEIVGRRFASAEYFIPDLIFSGEILRQVTEMVKPGLRGETISQKSGKLVLGTVAGDIHDIGKNIVNFMLDVSGFEVIDLGTDVAPERFVDALRKSGAPVLGLSGFLTLAFHSMKETIDAVKAAGLRDRVKIVIGGGQVDEQVRTYTGADAYGKDAMEAVMLARKWTGGS
jgi:methanogenic corrinoid protein MtbC1